MPKAPAGAAPSNRWLASEPAAVVAAQEAAAGETIAMLTEPAAEPEAEPAPKKKAAAKSAAASKKAGDSGGKDSR